VKRLRSQRAPSKNRRALTGLWVVLLLGVATFFAFTKANPFADRFELKAAFKTSNDLRPGSIVRIAGINVGKVTNIEGLGDGDDGALVTMELDERGLPLHRDATMKVRPRIFLEGNFFVDVRPGSPSAPLLEDGDTIPVNQTAAPVQFGQLLEALQSDTREDLQTFLQEYGRGVEGEGARGFNRSIRWWEPAYRNGAIVSDATRGTNGDDLSRYVAGARKVAEGLDRSPRALQNLITDFAVTADAFADEQRNLSAAIGELPNTLRTGRRALGTLNGAFPSVRRLVRDFRPGVRSSGPALDATLPFVRQLRGLTSDAELKGLANDLRPVVPALTELNRGGVALQEQGRRLSSCNNSVINPWQNETIPDPNFPSAGPVYQEASKGFTGLAGESRSFDANGQYVRSLAKTANIAAVAGTDRFFLVDQPLQGVNPPRARSAPAYRRDVPCETQERPDLRSNPGAAPQQRRIDQNAPGAAERRKRANEIAMEWMEDSLKMSGLDKALDLVDEPLRRDELDDVVRTLGGGK